MFIDKNKKNIIYLYNLTTNFKPDNLMDFNNTKVLGITDSSSSENNDNKKNKNKSNKVICRNFFLFLVLLKYNKVNFLSKSSFFIKPQKKNLQTILRAPYRHKLTRHQLTLTRYDIVFKIVFNSNVYINVKNFKNLFKIFKTLKSYNRWIESNLISNDKIKFSFNFSYKNNFIISNFVKNANKINNTNNKIK